MKFPSAAFLRLNQQQPLLAWGVLGLALVLQTFSITLYIGGLLEKDSTAYLARVGSAYGIILVPLGYYAISRLERWGLQINVREQPFYLLNFSAFALLAALFCLARVLLAADAIGIGGRTMFSYDSGWALFPQHFALIDLPTFLILLVFRLGSMTFIGDFRVAEFFGNSTNRKFLLLLFAWWVSLYLYVVFQHQGDFTPFTDRRTLDFREYKAISNGLVAWKFREGFYQIGYPAFLAPFNLLSGSFSYGAYSMRGMSELNQVMLIVVPFGVMGVAVILITAGMLQATDSSHRWVALWVCGLTFIVLLYAYGSYRPSYVKPGRGAGFTDITIGFIGGVEPFNTLLIAIAIYVLARPGRFSPWIGLAGGWAAMTKETNVVILALFLLLWFFSEGGRRHAIKTGLLAVGVFSLQFFYNIYVYGGGLMPHREFQNRIVARARARRLGKTPKKFKIPGGMGLGKVAANLPRILGNYLIPLVVVTVSYLVVMAVYRKRWQLWTFCYVTYLVLLVVFSAWGRIGATFRYLHVMAPLGATLVGPAMLFAIEKGEAKQREIRSNA